MPSVACQTEFAVDEATRLNETAIHIYLDILNILDDEPTPVIYDLGERAASQVLAAPVSMCVGSEDHPALSPSSPKGMQTLPGDLLNEAQNVTRADSNNVDEKSLVDLEEEEFRFENEMRARLAGIRKGLRDPVETWLEDQAFGVWRSRNPSSGTVSSEDLKPTASRLFFTNCMYENAFVPGSTLCVEIEEEDEEDKEEEEERRRKWNEYVAEEKETVSIDDRETKVLNPSPPDSDRTNEVKDKEMDNKEIAKEAADSSSETITKIAKG